MSAAPQVLELGRARASWSRATAAGWLMVPPPGVVPLEAWAPVGPGSAVCEVVERDMLGVRLRCSGVEVYVALRDLLGLEVEAVRPRA